jgi:hypothetical protein
MTRFRRYDRTVVMFTVTFFAGCATIHQGPRLSNVQAVHLADAEVRRTHYKVEDFWPGKAHYSSERDCWVVTYLDKRTGGGFEIEVSDATRKARLATFIDVWPAR